MADFYVARQKGSWYPVILETPNHIVIEGTAHDKTTLNPCFLQNLYAANINNTCVIMTNRYWIKCYYGAMSVGDPSSTKSDGGQGLAKNMWRSNYDPAEFYLYLPLSNNSLYRVRTADLVVLNSISGFVNGNEYNGRQGNGFIFNEVPTQVWISYNGDGSGSNASFNHDHTCSAIIGKSSWSNLGACNLNTYGGVQYQLLAKTAQHHIFSQSGPNNGSGSNNAHAANTCRFYIIAMDSTSAATTLLYDSTGVTATYQMHNGPSVPFASTVVPTIKMTYACLPLTTTSFYHISRVWWDDAAPLTNKGNDVCTISYAGTSFTAADHTGLTGNRYTLLMRTTVITNNVGQKFLCMTLTNTANWNTSGTSEPLTSFKTWVFKIEADYKTLIPTQVYQHDDRMYDLIPLNDSHTRAIWIFPNYLAFVVWNNSTSQYEVVNKVAVSARSVGVDELDRIWVLDYNGKVQLMTPFVPSRVAVTYELAEYNYQGTDISSYINISAYDAFGARLAANVTLTIDGNNCVFADGTSKKTVTTSGAADIQANITVNNSGYFRILANTEV